jgi:hypothetical protein
MIQKQQDVNLGILTHNTLSSLFSVFMSHCSLIGQLRLNVSVNFEMSDLCLDKCLIIC